MYVQMMRGIIKRNMLSPVFTERENEIYHTIPSRAVGAILSEAQVKSKKELRDGMLVRS